MKYLMAVFYAGVPAVGLGIICGALFQSWTVGICAGLFFLGLGLDVLLRGSDK